MTDLEITKLCAEAMELNVLEVESSIGGKSIAAAEPDCLATHYDPLHDDAQAMALVKKFGVTIDPAEEEPPFTWRACLPPFDGSDNAHADSKDLNRAICECVAAMQVRAKGQ